MNHRGGRAPRGGRPRPRNGPPQAPGSAAPAAPGPLPPAAPVPTGLKAPFALNTDQLVEIQRRFPNKNFIHNPNAPSHPHPIGAIERQETEDVAYKLAAGFIGQGDIIVDAGGNPNRHHTRRRSSVHSCCPVLSPIDIIRQANNMIGVRACTHRAEDCLCIPPANLAIHIAIHTIYYMTPSQILKCLQKSTTGVMFATHHTFPNIYGTMNLGESSYLVELNKTNEAIVTMTVIGNSAPYVHSNLSWMTAGYYEENGLAMAWNTKLLIGETTITQFVTSQVFPDRLNFHHQLSLVEAINNVHHSGVIDINPLVKLASGDKTKIDPCLQFISSTYIGAYSDNRYLGLVYNIIGQVNPGRVLVDKNVISIVASKLVNKPRNAQTFQLATHLAQQHINRLNLPPQLIADMVVHVTYAAFMKNIATETAAARSIFLQQTLLDQHTIAVNGKTITIPKKAILMGVGAVAALPLLYKYRLTITVVIRVVRYILNLLRALLGRRTLYSSLWANVWAFISPMLHKSKFGITTMSTALIKLFKLIVSKLPSFKEPITPMKRVSFCTDSAPNVEEIHPSAQIDTADAQYRCQESFGNMQLGIGSVVVRPVVSRACTHNEYRAVLNRGLCINAAPNPSQTKAQWQHLTQWVDRQMRTMHKRLPKKIHPIPFADWLLRFPESHRAILAKAKADLTPGLDEAKGIHLSKSFVKRENVMKQSQLGVQDYSPRLIQGRTPSYQVITGPYTLALSKYLAREWSRFSSGGILYSSGLTANELGHWFETRMNAWSSNVKQYAIVENDCSLWDGTLEVPAIKHELRFYRKYTRPSRVVQQTMDMQVTTKGITPHGVFYSVDGKRKSGDGNTSCGNSIINGHVHAYQITRAACQVAKNTGAKYNMCDSDHTVGCGAYSGGDSVHDMAILGDDNIMFMAMDVAQELLANQTFSLYGLRPKFKLVTPFTAEYCSGRFWPSHIGIIWGPKIGRVICKTFYAITDLKPTDYKAHLRGVCLGLAKDVAHIPILRVVVARTLQLTSDEHRVLRNTDPDLHKHHASQHGEAVDDTYRLIYEVYGLTQFDVADAEEYLDIHFTTLPFTAQHYAIDTMVAIDSGIDIQANTTAYVPPSLTACATDASIFTMLQSTTLDLLKYTFQYVRSVANTGKDSNFITFFDEAVIVNPILEELLKHWWPPMAHLIGVMELMNDGFASPAAFIARVFGWWLHVKWSKKHISTAILIHSISNFLSLMISTPHRDEWIALWALAYVAKVAVLLV
jgi:hypothetical protein